MEMEVNPIELTDSNGNLLMFPMNHTYLMKLNLTKQDLIDENIELLVEDGQLKDVVKDEKEVRM